MLLRLAYLTVTNMFAALRLMPMSDRAKDVEILALRHEITVLERQLGSGRVQLTPEDRAFPAALLTPLPRQALHRLRLLVQPDTVLRWHRDLTKRRHARTCRTKKPGRPPTAHSIRKLILRLVRENPSWGYRRVHGELTTLGIQIAASTVWEILTYQGIDLALDRAATTWADFLRSQADALLACDVIETVTHERHLRHALLPFELHYNAHRPHQAIDQTAPLRAAPRTTLQRTDHPTEGAPERPPRRSPPRVPACRLRCTDGVFGRRRGRLPGGQCSKWVSRARCR
ncbi:hypothetical protein [Streptomyces endophyticus]|uniref:Integrase catalytic domain-containing protein n=1 Tax=Streptomyces endophyticus TaxID=714166 RepID=A0ABU6F5K9_9ACTN|nr:hypothetical protein [Streptomyces endophyticus]MEB8338112.1 hypothetical protein [Streptomyces endophyticus]